MDEFVEAKKWITASIVATAFLSTPPCLVRHICLTADGSNNPIALVYNGENANSPLKLALACLAKTHFGDCFDVPVYFSRGIYVTISTDITLFTIQYQEEVAH